MLGLGTAEVLVVALAFLVFFGPERLPSVARRLGAYSARLRRELDDMREAIEDEARDVSDRPRRP